jgi:hypothetical protein
MIASIFPDEAKTKALRVGIPSSKAKRRATSELKGRIVAAKKAEKKRVSSAIQYSL